MTDDEVDVLFDKHMKSTIPFLIRDLAAKHYEPLVAAKDKELFFLKEENRINFMNTKNLSNKLTQRDKRVDDLKAQLAAKDKEVERITGLLGRATLDIETMKKEGHKQDLAWQLGRNELDNFESENATLRAEVERLTENNKGLMAQLVAENPSHTYPYIRGRIKEAHKGLRVVLRKIKHGRERLEELEKGSLEFAAKSGWLSILDDLRGEIEIEIRRLYDIANSEGVDVKMEVESFETYRAVGLLKRELAKQVKINGKLEKQISGKAAELTRLKADVTGFAEWEGKMRSATTELLFAISDLKKIGDQSLPDCDPYISASS